MMLRNLFDEVMRRRLWPILALAALVAIAAPLLFLKSAPTDAPPAPAPAAAPAGELPARAQQLLATTGAEARTAKARAKRRGSDPFQPPSSAQAPSDESDTPAKETAGAGGNSTKPVPVVITNAEGTTPSSATATATAPGTSSGAAPIGDDTTTTVAKRTTSVDIRFGERYPGKLHRGIPRTQTFVAGGRVIAIFVKYSPKRDKAVFAIASSTLVTGDIECRRKNDLCRYVDIPAGESVRLTMLASDGSLVTRRLAVERIGRTPSAGATAAAASHAPANGSCLLGKLLTMSAQDAPLAADACKS